MRTRTSGPEPVPVRGPHGERLKVVAVPTGYWLRKPNYDGGGNADDYGISVATAAAVGAGQWIAAQLNRRWTVGVISQPTSIWRRPRRLAIRRWVRTEDLASVIKEMADAAQKGGAQSG